MEAPVNEYLGHPANLQALQQQRANSMMNKLIILVIGL
jgi:hypothetical protein